MAGVKVREVLSVVSWASGETVTVTSAVGAKARARVRVSRVPASETAVEPPVWRRMRPGAVGVT